MIRKFAVILVAAFLTWTPALASEAVQVSVPVSCEADEDEAGGKYVVLIEPQDESYRDTIKKEALQFSGTGSDAFTLEYSEPGNYIYTVYQQPFSEVYFDESSHSVKVYVSWDDNGNLTAYPVIFKDGKKEKELGIKFLNIPTSYYHSGDESEESGIEDNTSGSEDIPDFGNDAEVSPVVQTKDGTPIGLYTGLLAASAICILLAIVEKRRKKQN